MMPKKLVANGVIAVSEGANMPSTRKLSAYSKKPKSFMLRVKLPMQVVYQYPVLK